MNAQEILERPESLGQSRSGTDVVPTFDSVRTELPAPARGVVAGVRSINQSGRPQVISQSEMMPLMLKACPSFEGEWREFRDSWQGESDPPIYAALTDLACHLIAMLSRGDVSTFPDVFAVVERWHVEGNPFVAEAATVGLLEDLQNTNFHNGTDPEQFRQYLLPESLKWWDKLHAFWQRGEILR